MNIYDQEEDKVILKIKKLVPHAIVPEYKTKGSSGMDVCASHDGMIYPNDYQLVQTGLQFEIPLGYEVQVRPRSGLALKNGVTVLNSPGTIDSDYRGPVGLILVNHGKEKFNFSRGDRLAQIVLCKVQQATVELTTDISETERGEGGFGSTGVK